MREERAKIERTIAEIARRQHGVITLEQLLWAGLSRSGITRRVQAARLHRLHRGVYAVGHTDLSRDGRWLAAVLACGDGAVLSHVSAAHLWSMSPTSPSLIHVTVPSRNGRRRRQGIRLHYRDGLVPSNVTRRKNIPVTTRSRTRRDLGWDASPTRSGIERQFLGLLKKHGIPKPETNVPIGPHTVDYFWRDRSLVVELDSYAYHSDRPTFTSDRARDRYLKARGLDVHRYTDDELDESPDAVVSSLLALLQERRCAGPRRRGA
jgi:very-short-patch-repair endonuclease